MSKDCERLHQDAEALYEKIRDKARADAVLDITSAFIDLVADTNRDVMDAVENKVLHQEHH